MANITISDLATSPVCESLITELDEQITNVVIGGCDAKFRRNGSLKSFENCTADELKTLLVIPNPVAIPP
ncbi:MAG: hypothetical protein F6K65_37165 [Moorea sp. SIO3C2]|nr:hypothetical protein [Moorena sp. SIO3C2]